MGMELKIRFLYGDSQSYETIVDGQNSISSIKSLISPHIQLESDLQKWVYKGKILTEQQETLAFYDFRDGDTIHIIKSISKQSPSSSASTSFHQQTPVTYPVPYFDQAMGSYLNRNPNEENVKNCLSTISKILSNIIDHPHEEKYRRIKNTNQHFHKKVGSQEGSQQLLQSLGFQLQGEEWILHPNAETWNTIVTCQQKLTKFLEKLKSTPTTSSLPSHSPSPSSVSPSKGNLIILSPSDLFDWRC
jgi:ubiquilin